MERIALSSGQLRERPLWQGTCFHMTVCAKGQVRLFDCRRFSNGGLREVRAGTVAQAVGHYS